MPEKRKRGRPKKTAQNNVKKPTESGNVRKITAWMRGAGGSSKRGGGKPHEETESPFVPSSKLRRTPTKKDEQSERGENSGGKQAREGTSENEDTDTTLSLEQNTTVIDGKEAKIAGKSGENLNNKEEESQDKVNQELQIEWNLEKKWAKWSMQQQKVDQAKWEEVFVTVEEVIRKEINRGRKQADMINDECQNCKKMETQVEIAKVGPRADSWREAAQSWQRKAQLLEEMLAEERRAKEE